MKKNKKKINQYIKIIEKIEKTRAVNNINWMNILRIAIVNDPNKTINVMKKINSKDKRISNLLSKLVG